MSQALGDYQPSLNEVAAAARTAKTVQVSREVVADLDTPVSAYLKIRDGSPSFLLESVEGGEHLGRYSFLGSAPRRVLRVKNGRQWFEGQEASACSNPLQSLKEIIAGYKPVFRTGARFEGGVIGYLSYEAARYFERLPIHRQDPLDLPDAAFLDVDSLLIFDHVAHKIRIVSTAWLDGGLRGGYEKAVARIDEIAGRLARPLDGVAATSFTSGAFSSNISQSDYEAMVRAAKCHIRAGDILQVVLAQRLSAPLEGDSFGVYRRLRAVNPSPFMYYLDFGDHQIVGASPELLVQVEGEAGTTRPIAGTRPRGRTPVDDSALAHDLLHDEKERAEHLMLVDLARNDMGRVCRPGTVEVPHFMGIERFSHVMHLVSDVTGRLRNDCDSFDALRASFPAGTVSGAPKIRAMEIIADLENDARGPYAGAVGFVNVHSDMEMAITIRTGVIKDRILHVQAGAGIVADSEPEREFVETMNKARALLEATRGT